MVFSDFATKLFYLRIIKYDNAKSTISSSLVSLHSAQAFADSILGIDSASILILKII
jgi:hypothetical protein